MGAFEPDGLPRSVDSIAPEGFAEFPPDWEHFAPVRRNAEQRVPALRGTTYDRFLNAPEAFTPDANFCLGESSELFGLFVAAGFNSQGIIFGPGAGKAIAEWVVQGSPHLRRFRCGRATLRQIAGQSPIPPRAEPKRRLAACTPCTGRSFNPSRRAAYVARHSTSASKVPNACFGETTGWERANWFASPGTEPTYEYSYNRQNWFDLVGEEHKAAREAVALFDLSSFAKIEIAGPDALEVVQELCTANLDMAPGRVRYTLMLNRGGGIELDGTVARLDEQRFLMITPAFSQYKTLGMLRKLARGRAVAVFDATAGLATIGVMGPWSRELMERISPDGLVRRRTEVHARSGGRGRRRARAVPEGQLRGRAWLRDLSRRPTKQ